jgi:alkanesulfonate monooxygenase SsuD/methylene tetrahydromethanopterin reductase-like flavin-dependent oxidoreductase (luciferase family)
LKANIKYGINVPNFGDYHLPDTLVELAVKAEDAGWDGFFIWDHIEGAWPFCDPTVALSVIANNTSHIRLGTMVTPLPRRRPWKIAREMVSLDHLSKGRIILGVGLGNPPNEYSKFGEETRASIRAEKLDESLEIIKGLWSGEEFNYIGKHYTINEVVFLPKPYQKPSIPIWVGGFWPNKLPFRRAARYEGVYPAMDWPNFLSHEDLRNLLKYIQRHRKNQENFDVVIGGNSPGDPEKGVKIVEPWIDTGATWWSEDINGWRGTIDEMKERISLGPPKT